MVPVTMPSERDVADGRRISGARGSPLDDGHPVAETGRYRELATRHLETALGREAPAEKNYYIRSALQALEFAAEAERPER